MIDEEPEPEPPEPQTGSKRKIIWGSTGAALLLLGAVAYYVVVSRQAAAEAEAAARAAEQPSVIYVEDPDNVLTGALLHLEPFTLNLGGTESFLKIELIVEYFELHLPEAVQTQRPKLRDAAIRVLSDKSPEELLSVDGKSTLRLELIDAFNKSLDAEEEIVDVYFTHFTIQ